MTAYMRINPTKIYYDTKDDIAAILPSERDIPGLNVYCPKWKQLPPRLNLDYSEWKCRKYGLTTGLTFGKCKLHWYLSNNKPKHLNITTREFGFLQ